MKKWTEIEKQKVAYLWNSGVLAKNISREFGVSVHSIKALARSLPECDRRREVNTISPEQINLAKTLWNEGLTVQEIANRLGFDSRDKLNSLMRANRDIFPKRGDNSRFKSFRIKQEKKFIALDQIEDPPKKTPVPNDALFLPWVDLQPNQCQWHMNDGLENFHDPPSNTFPCCGLPVETKGKRFCNHHLKYAVKTK